MRVSRSGMWCGAGTLVDHIVIEHRSAGNAPHTVVVPQGSPGALRCELDVISVTQVRLAAGSQLTVVPEGGSTTRSAP